MVPAVKLPDASLATIAEAVLTFVAVVAELLTLPAVAMVASLVSTIAADALIAADHVTSTMVPLRIIVLVTVPVSPTVTTLLPPLVRVPGMSTVPSFAIVSRLKVEDPVVVVEKI
jgi:hypothetical protein